MSVSSGSCSSRWMLLPLEGIKSILSAGWTDRQEQWFAGASTIRHITKRAEFEPKSDRLTVVTLEGFRLGSPSASHLCMTMDSGWLDWTEQDGKRGWIVLWIVQWVCFVISYKLGWLTLQDMDYEGLDRRRCASHRVERLFRKAF